MIERLNYGKINPDAIRSVLACKKHMPSIDPKLRALVELRISQINGCVYCVDLHSTEAREAGESQQRLDCLPAWEECRFFDDRERVAIAWAEAVTHLPETGAPDEIYDQLGDHFSDQEIVDLTFIISNMNALNRLAVSFRHMPDQRT